MRHELWPTSPVELKRTVVIYSGNTIILFEKVDNIVYGQFRNWLGYPFAYPTDERLRASEYFKTLAWDEMA